jgi:hypothetical protein
MHPGGDGKRQTKWYCSEKRHQGATERKRMKKFTPEWKREYQCAEFVETTAAIVIVIMVIASLLVLVATMAGAL